MSERVVTRREFVRRAAAAGGVALLAPLTCLHAQSVRAGAAGLKVGFVLPRSGTASGFGAAAAMGAELGAAEAAQAAMLLGREFTYVRAAADEASEVSRAARRLSEQDRVIALVGGADEGSAFALQDEAERAGVLFLNIGYPGDVLRGRGCRPTTFHIEASEAMRRDARALAPATAPEVPGAGPVRAELWHPTLSRYGAGQLIDRFEVQYGRAMTSPAWAGWMAVKILWEAAARSRATDAKGLLGFLESPRAHFDGHKGVPLSFRSGDHQLRQPLYLVHGDGDAAVMVAEVPRPAPDREQTTQEVLDQIGVAASGFRCGGTA